MIIPVEKLMASARRAMTAAVVKSVAAGITVVDEGGHIVLQLRMDQANFMTNQASELKARTAFLFNCPTHLLREMVQKMPLLQASMQVVPGEVLLLEGGFPLRLNGKIIGGLGVAGGNFEQDLLVANAFLENFNEA